MAMGACLGVAAWLALGQLGLPEMVGRAPIADLGWAAIAGAGLGLIGALGVLWAVVGLSTALVLAIGWSPFMVGRARTMVRSDPPSAPAPDAVVVLSNRLTTEGRIGAEALSRLLGGFALAGIDGVRHIVLTRIREHQGRDTATSDRDQRELVAQFAPGLTLHLIGPVESTHDEAVATATLAREQGWRRIAVVTSPLHTRRACAAFEHEGLLVLCRSAVARQYAPDRLSGAGDRLNAFRDWAYEVVATFVYRRKGWVR
jgi:uncharacterized SAM-binding protein YcdF (DUF218 family)